MKSSLVPWLVLLLFLSIQFAASKSPITSVATSENCVHKWVCTNWMPDPCLQEENQERTCKNIGTCSDDLDKPIEKRRCPKTTKKSMEAKLELQDNILHKSEILTALVVLHNFESEPTDTNIEYSILDESGEEVFSGKDYFSVETEEIITKKFGELSLRPGRYLLVMKIIYNDGTEEESVQEFRIEEEETKYLNYVLSGFSVFLIIFFLILLIKNRMKEH